METTNSNQLYMRIDHFVGDYYIVLDFRAEEDNALTNISVAKEHAGTGETYFFTCTDGFSTESYIGSINSLAVFDLFRELICCIEVDGEKGLLEFIDDNKDIYTGKA